MGQAGHLERPQQRRIDRVVEEIDAWGRAAWAWAATLPLSVFIAAIILLIALLLTLATSFGESWDLIFSERRGRSAFAFLFGGFDAAKYLAINGVTGRYYGPAFDVLIKFVQDLVSQDPVRRFEIRTVIQAFATLSCLVPAFLISTRVVSRPAAFIGVLLLASTPMFLGHAFINAKDSIFASAVLWSVFLISHCYEDGRKPGPGSIILLAISLALTTSMRALGAYLLFLIPLVVIGLPPLRLKGASLSSRISFVRQQVVAYLPGFLLLLGVFVVAYLIFMPSILAELLSQGSSKIIGISAAFPWRGRVLYFGTLMPATHIPWHYLFGYWLVQLPLYYHLFLVTVLFALLLFYRPTVKVLSHFIRENKRGLFAVVVLSLAFFIPVLLVLVLDPVLYNTGRQMLFLVPMLFLLLYFGFCGLVRHMSAGPRLALCAVVALAWIESTVALVRLHPYEYVYYNPIAKPEGSLELDYWGTSLREVAERLNDYAAAKPGKLKVQVCGSRRLLGHRLDPDKFELLSSKDMAKGANPDLILAWNLASIGCMDLIKDKQPWLITVERRGLVFAAVADRSSEKASESPPTASRPR